MMQQLVWLMCLVGLLLGPGSSGLLVGNDAPGVVTER
jgi:hypothetical protein